MPKSGEINIRPFQASNRGTILNFCQHTWEHEEDYIPDVLEKWIADSHCHILAADLLDEP